MLRVGYTAQDPEIFGDADVVQGFLPELLTALFDPLNIETRYVACTPAACLAGLAEGRLDMVPAVPPEVLGRSELRYAHESVLLSSFAIFSSTKGPELVDLRGLDGRRLAVLEKGREVVHFRSLAKDRGWSLELVERPSMASVLAAIRDDEADFGVVTRAFGARHAEALGVVETPHTLHQTPLYLAFRSELDVAFVEHINTQLAGLKVEVDSVYHRLHRRWHPPPSALQRRRPLDLKLAVALLAALAVTTAVAFVYRQRAHGVSSLLLRNRHRIASVTEAVGLGVWECDLATDVVRWDSSMYRLYEREPTLPPPKPAEWITFLHPDDRARVAAEAKKDLTSGGRFQNEFRVRREGGSERVIRIVGHVVEAGEKGDTVVVGINLDITEFRRLERRLQHAEKMEAVGNLTGGIAHDFNNRLMVIRNNLAMAIEDERDEDVKSMLRDALGAADACAALTARLLAFARQRDMTSRPTELNRVVRRSARLLRRTLPATMDIRIEASDAAIWSEVDETLLENALINLALNARDALDAEGGIRVRTLRRSPSEEGPAENVIRLEDDGAGMSPETLARAFEPFFTTKPVGRGTGLGLAMVHGFVHQSGGDIVLESQEGVGTVVEMSFPAVAEPVGSVDASTGDLPEDPHINRALVCEDDEDVQVTLRHLFKALGVEHRVVGTAEEALALMERDFNFDVVLSDVVMPGPTDGVELAHRLRRDHPGLPVILMSGYARRSEDHQRPPPEGTIWLRKPFSKARLADALAASLARSESRLERPEDGPITGEAETADAHP